MRKSPRLKFHATTHRHYLLILLAVLGLITVFTPQRIAAQSATLSLPDKSALTDPAFARDGYAGIATPFLKRTRYLLALDVNWPAGKVNGVARILYVNNTGTTLSKVEFRLYPNHPIPAVYTGAYTGAKPRMLISSVTVSGTAVKWDTANPYQTVLNVPLPTPLAPGDQVEIGASYTITYLPPTDSLDVREAFPLLAVYENRAWREEITTKSLDFVFSELALFAVTIHTTNSATLYTTGVITRTEPDSNGSDVTYHITTGPVRDFVFLLAKGWGYLPGKGAPVPIDVHYKGSASAAQEETDLAVQAMTFFDHNFGAYPYAHLTVLVLSYPTGGEEYPTLIMNDNARDTNYRRFIIAHEVAHQWFYGVAGDDIARHAWLDESLAQISMYLFYRAQYGTDVADAEWTHILTWANQLKGTPRPIDTAVADFTDFSDYMRHTYGLGAVFMRNLAAQIGYDHFTAGLAAYYKTAYLEVGTPQQFFDAMQAQTSIPLATLFCQKMGDECTTGSK